MTQAEIFNAFMVATWNNGDDIPHYATFNDAIVVAHRMGAVLYPVDAADGDGGEFLFRDGSTIWIIMDDAGVGVGCQIDGREPTLP